MLYLNDTDLETMGFQWNALIDTIENAITVIGQKEYAQPVKPYLRYGDSANRIIAMPGYIGGSVQKAGIKWIASFPRNIEKGIKRAHSVTIVNNAETGIPEAIINGGLVSAIRTAAVSGAVLRKYLRDTGVDSIEAGMTGFGPIGQMHADMLRSIAGEKLKSLSLYDLRQPDLSRVHSDLRSKLNLVSSWQEAYQNKQVFMTCTVSTDRYINIPATQASLHLNVSLRDYQMEAMKSMDTILVDNWDEICRENTDIHKMHLDHGLERSGVLELDEFFLGHQFEKTSKSIFNPMGMAVFDIAIANYFVGLAKETATGNNLPD